MKTKSKSWSLNLTADYEGRPNLLGKIMIYGIAVASAAVLGDAFMSGKETGPIIGGSLVVLFAFIYFLNLRGYTLLGSKVFIVVIWLLFPVLVMLSKGIHDPLLSGHFAVILLAGILIGKRAALWTGLLSILAAGMIAYFTEAGWVNDILQMESQTQALVYGAIFLVCAVSLALMLQDNSNLLWA